MNGRTSYYGYELAQASTQRRAEVEAALMQVRQARETDRKSRIDVEAQYRQALQELVANLIPALDARNLSQAAWYSGYAPLAHPDVFRRMQQERQKLQSRIGEIESDPRYRNRELLRAPRVGTLSQQLAELQHYRAPLAAFITQCAHPRLQSLLQSAYGTPQYNVGFWRTGYYADWKAGDEILERFPGKRDFSQVRDEYLQTSSALAVYDTKIAETLAEIQRGEQLEKEYQDSTLLLTNIEQRYLDWLRNSLYTHLSQLDIASLGPRLSQAPHLAVLATRVAGLAAKSLYLNRIAAQYFDQTESTLLSCCIKKPLAVHIT